MDLHVSSIMRSPPVTNRLPRTLDYLFTWREKNEVYLFFYLKYSKKSTYVHVRRTSRELLLVKLLYKIITKGEVMTKLREQGVWTRYCSERTYLVGGCSADYETKESRWVRFHQTMVGVENGETSTH